jgi:hypothetical protein
MTAGETGIIHGSPVHRSMGYQGHRSVTKHDGSTKDGWYSYICGHCNTKVSGAVVCGYYEDEEPPIKWLLCPNCGNGSVLAKDGNVYPGVPFGPNIEGLPEDVLEAYKEARNCMTVNAFTSCELMCRKILMHVAVEKGAKEGDTFATYLSYLEEQGFVTPPMKGWVDLIRRHGNKATHSLESPDKKRAESTLMFTAELLRLIYEMEHISKQYTEET